MSTSIPSIQKEIYSQGQLLGLTDFTREQNFHIDHREFQTKELLSSGVLSGLTLTNPSDKTIAISQGAAIDENGAQIMLSNQATYNGNQISVSGGSLSITFTETTGVYQLTIAQNYYQASSTPAPPSAVNSPLIKLVPSGTALSNEVLLATIEFSTTGLTLTAKSEMVQILSTRLPQEQLSNLNASIITQGQFHPAQIPLIQNLNGQLSANQIPFLNGLDKTVFSTGVLSGLRVSSSAQNIELKPGIAIADDGSEIVLSDSASFYGSVISITNGSFLLDMSSHAATNGSWAITIANNTTTPSSPLLNIVSVDNTEGVIVLGTATENNNTLSVDETSRQIFALKTNYLPKLTSTQIPNLDASQVPDIQDLNGSLSIGQLPFWNNFDKTIFSYGVLKGLSLSVDTQNNQNILLSSGSVMGIDGNYMLLTTKVSYKGAIISLANGSFTLDMSAQAEGDWLVTVAYNTATPAIPVLDVVLTGTQSQNSVVLGTATKSNTTIVTSLVGRQVLTLNVNQVPDLQNLNGQLLKSQLPSDIGASKTYLTFFVDLPIIKSGSSAHFSWTSSYGVDSLTLSYLSGTTIAQLTNAAGQIQLTQSGYQITPTETTTYTLTAKISGTVVAQNQLTITVIPAPENIDVYTKGLFSQGISLVDAIPKITNKFSLTTYNINNATTLANALKEATYTLLDIVSEVATYYSQSKNWTLMEQLAGTIEAPTPTSISNYVKSLPSPVPGYLEDNNFSFLKYGSEILTSVITPVGKDFISSNVSTYAIYCFANGVYISKNSPETVNNWNDIVSLQVLTYYQGLHVSLPTNFSAVVTAATPSN